jgi:hypothetical protein
MRKVLTSVKQGSLNESIPSEGSRRHKRQLHKHNRYIAQINSWQISKAAAALQPQMKEPDLLFTSNDAWENHLLSMVSVVYGVSEIFAKRLVSSFH